MANGKNLRYIEIVHVSIECYRFIEVYSLSFWKLKLLKAAPQLSMQILKIQAKNEEIIHGLLPSACRLGFLAKILDNLG